MVTKWFKNDSDGAVKNEKLKQKCEIMTNEWLSSGIFGSCNTCNTNNTLLINGKKYSYFSAIIH